MIFTIPCESCFRKINEIACIIAKKEATFPTEGIFIQGLGTFQEIRRK